MKKDQKTIMVSFLVITFLGVIIIFFGFYNKKDQDKEIVPEIEIETETTEIAKDKEVAFEIIQKDVDDSVNGNGYSFSVLYPKTNNDLVNQEIKDFLETQKNDLRTILRENAGNQEAEYSLNINYKDTFGKNNKSIVFSVDNYTGGAHSNFYYKTFSYNQDGKKVLITDILKTDTTEFSQFLIQKVLEMMPADFLEQGGSDWINQGINSDANTFSNFAFEEVGIRFFFDPYQIGPWALGPQQILINYSDLEKFLQF